MPDNFDALERYLRSLPADEQNVILSFEQIERILGGPLPPSALDDAAWWGNQKPGTTVEVIPWMDAGWMVDKVDFRGKHVHFVRQ